MKKFIFILLVVGINKLSAQEMPNNSIQIGWGVSNLMRQDLTMSPFIHKDWSPVNAFLSYSRSKKVEQQFTLKYRHYNPMRTASYEFNSFYNGKSTTVPHSFGILDIDYSLGKELIREKKWSMVLGGKSRNFIYASDYLFGDSGPSPMIISFGLDTWIKAVYRLNEKNYFVSSLSLPLFSFVYRDPYLAQDDEYFENLYSHKGLKELTSRIADGEWRSWGKAQRVEFNIQYGYVINRKWDITTHYLFSLNVNQYPTRFTQLENTFLITGKFKF